MRHRKKQLGFLLVEILVALAILAIPLAAITRAVSQAIDTTAALRDRSIALWVAQDRLTMHRIERVIFWVVLGLGAITLVVLAGWMDPPLAFLLEGGTS